MKKKRQLRVRLRLGKILCNSACSLSFIALARNSKSRCSPEVDTKEKRKRTPHSQKKKDSYWEEREAKKKAPKFLVKPCSDHTCENAPAEIPNGRFEPMVDKHLWRSTSRRGGGDGVCGEREHRKIQPSSIRPTLRYIVTTTWTRNRTVNLRARMGILPPRHVTVTPRTR